MVMSHNLQLCSKLQTLILVSSYDLLVKSQDYTALQQAQKAQISMSSKLDDPQIFYIFITGLVNTYQITVQKHFTSIPFSISGNLLNLPVTKVSNLICNSW